MLFCVYLKENEENKKYTHVHVQAAFAELFDGSSFSLSEAKLQSDKRTCLKHPDQRAGDLNMLFGVSLQLLIQ